MSRGRASRRQAERRAYLHRLCRTVPYSYVERVLAAPTEESIPELDNFDGVVLSADLLGFTSLCERLAAGGPEGLSRLTDTLNALFSNILEKAVFPFAGYVIHFAGDSLCAVYREEDSEGRAVASALAVRDHVDAIREQLTGDDAAFAADLYVRVGLARGPVNLFVLGDMSQRHVVCAGTTAHCAQDLMARAPPGSVRVDALIASALESRATVRTAEGSRDLEVVSLSKPPDVVPIEEIGDRADGDIEAKISLLEPFVPAPLAGRLRNTPTGWRVDGELREVVVLTAEVGGLDGPTDGTDEGRARSVENARNVTRSMLRAFRKYGGLTTRAELTQQGHRISVLFGLHRPAENDAERALLAALEAASRLRGFGVARGSQVTLRTGLHTGSAYFGAFGSDYRHDLTIVGSTVSIAARFAARADPFAVLASKELVDRVGEDFETSPSAPVVVPGIAEPVPSVVVHAPSDGRSHYVRHRRIRRVFAGRDVAIAQLRDLVDRAMDGEGLVFGLRGEPGTGKSALLSFLIDEWTARGGTGVLARCRYATQAVPLAPIVSMFESFLGLTARDTESERRERIRSGLEPYLAHHRADDLLSLLLPVERPDRVTESLVDFADPHARDRLLHSIIHIVKERVRAEPVLYILEDLHNADALTLELAIRIATSLQGSGKFLLAATYRPDPVVDRMREAVEREIHLGALDDTASAELIAHEVGADSVEPAFLAFLMRRTGGNPRYLVEVARFLKERGLTSVRGGVAVAPTADDGFLEDVVPASLAQMTLARLDEMEPAERRLLRTASAIGPRFSRELLEAAWDLDADSLFAALANLECSEVITLDAEHGFTFRDEVTRAVTYRTIPGSERREVHRRIADALEHLEGTAGHKSPTAIALHRERAGDLVSALPWYARAAQLSLRAGLSEDTCALVEKWEAIADGLPANEAPSRSERAAVATIKLMALGRRGVPGDTLAQCRDMVGHQLVFEEPTRRIVDFWLGDAMILVGELEAAREKLSRTFKLASEPAMKGDVALLLAKTYELAGDRAQATAWIDQAAALGEGDHYRSLRVALARCDLELEPDALVKAFDIYTDIKSKAAGLSYRKLEAQATNGRAHAAMHLRRFGDAIEGFQYALELYRSQGSWGDVANALVNLGQVLVWSDRLSEAEPHLERALTTAEQARDELCATEARVHLGAVVALTESLHEGRAMVRQGIERATEMGWPEPRIAGHLHLLRIGLVSSDIDAVRAARAFLQGNIESFPTLLFQQMFANLEHQARASEEVTEPEGQR